MTLFARPIFNTMVFLPESILLALSSDPSYENAVITSLIRRALLGRSEGGLSSERAVDSAGAALDSGVSQNM